MLGGNLPNTFHLHSHQLKISASLCPFTGSRSPRATAPSPSPRSAPPLLSPPHPPHRRPCGEPELGRVSRRHGGRNSPSGVDLGRGSRRRCGRSLGTAPGCVAGCRPRQRLSLSSRRGGAAGPPLLLPYHPGAPSSRRQRIQASALFSSPRRGPCTSSPARSRGGVEPTPHGLRHPLLPPRRVGG